MEEAFIHLHNGGQGAPNITIDANHYNPPHKGQSHHASLVPVLLPLNTYYLVRLLNDFSSLRQGINNLIIVERPMAEITHYVDKS